ncbi:hypothetical protein [Micromonospora humi]|uniref:Uncharacterized protein n=1 Tax=Micromonospora humi TaxID=745366 RepID=A0A1C5GSZ8_9ACTN|nr:hypothetical protein [Micromonospora humi]SCG36271.1 hypothetical protein GA0070213_101442 [Micromonospora humi]
MNSPGPAGPADRAESDRRLDAARAAPPAGGDPLARLLAAAAAPATGDELAGEERALAAFRAARAAPAVTERAPAPRPRRRLRIAAALSGLAATAVAGVAFAAVRLDHGPEPVVPPTSTTAGTGPTGTGPSRPAPSGPAGEASGAAASPTPPSPTPPSSAGPPPGGHPAPPPVDGKLAGQCRAYLAKPEGQRAKALTKPGFADLVAAAGGADRVESYCRGTAPSAAAPTPPEPKSKKSSADEDRRPGPDDEDDD